MVGVVAAVGASVAFGAAYLGAFLATRAALKGAFDASAGAYPRLASENAVVSGLHSIVSGCFVVFCMWQDPGVFADLGELFEGERDPLLWDVALLHTVGYLLYDTLSFLWFWREPAMLLHHVLIIVCFGWSASLSLYEPFLVLGLLAEPNSALMHARKFLRLRRITSGLLYSLVVRLLLWTYVPLRVLPHVWVTMNVWWCRSFFLTSTHFYVAFGGMLLLNALNMYFLYRFGQTDVVKGSSSKPSKA